MTHPIRIIEEPALRQAVTPRTAVEAMHDAFRADGEGRTLVPDVINLTLEHARGEFHVKTAYIEGVPYVAIKVASGFFGNAAKGLPSGSGLMAVFSAETGMPAALLLDNAFLTDIRTGAAGAIAAHYLARDDVCVVGVIGAGVQAREQVRCLLEVRAPKRLVVWNRSTGRLDRYCEGMRRSTGLEVTAASSPEEVCRTADVLITTTPATTPLVHAEWLHPGIHVTAVGSDSPGKQELAGACLARADLVVVDRLSQCARFGELRAGIAEGLLTPDSVHAQLGEVVAGRRPGRTFSDQITIADLTGVGFQDTAIASAALSTLTASTRAPG